MPLEDSQDFKKQYKNWQTGVNGIVIQLDKVLAELGVKKIDAVGKKFDPHFHEAVKEVEKDKEIHQVIVDILK
jgi:molecular chaperone GrpE